LGELDDPRRRILIQALAAGFHRARERVPDRARFFDGDVTREEALDLRLLNRPHPRRAFGASAPFKGVIHCAVPPVISYS
jgi:hypothetical protein